MAVFPFSHHLFSCPCVDITRIEKLANNRPFDSFRFLSFSDSGCCVRHLSVPIHWIREDIILRLCIWDG